MHTRILAWALTYTSPHAGAHAGALAHTQLTTSAPIGEHKNNGVRGKGGGANHAQNTALRSSMTATAGASE